MSEGLPAEDETFAPPTSRLPPLKLIQSTPLAELRSCVEYLRIIYNPEVRGSRRRRATTAHVVSDAKSARRQERETALGDIRADAFERSYAIRWLTALVSRSDEVLVSQDESIEGYRGWEGLVEDAAALLAACAGASASGRVTRTYSLGPSPTQESILLKLSDAPLENEDYASVGAQTWGGACVLADMIFENPDRFDLPSSVRTDVDVREPLRVLELGAGTGLVGLAVAKLLELRNVPAEVVLTDVHPSVLANLRSNVAENFAPNPTSCISVSVQPLDWSLVASSSNAADSCGTFDLVLGADIVYEAQHAVWIKACLEKLLRSGHHFHLVIPLRRTHTAESSTVQQVFGQVPSNTSFEIIDQERCICEAHSDSDFRSSDRADEVEYAYYKILLKG